MATERAPFPLPSRFCLPFTSVARRVCSAASLHHHASIASDHASSERSTLAIEGLNQPACILVRRMLKAKIADQQRHELEAHELTRVRLEGREVHQREIGPICSSVVA